MKTWLGWRNPQEHKVSRCFVNGFFLENFAGKYLCRSLFLMKFQALRPIALLKIDYNKDERCFSENFVKFQECIRCIYSFLQSVVEEEEEYELKWPDLWDLQPLSLYRKNKALYLTTGLFNKFITQQTGILSPILQSTIYVVCLLNFFLFTESILVYHVCGLFTELFSETKL